MRIPPTVEGDSPKIATPPPTVSDTNTCHPGSSKIPLHSGCVGGGMFPLLVGGGTKKVPPPRFCLIRGIPVKKAPIIKKAPLLLPDLEKGRAFL